MKLLSTLIVLFFSIVSVAQPLPDNLDYKTISVDTWTNADAFKFGPRPPITSFGEKSDSLAKTYNVTAFYELKGTYYSINNWADYFYWFTKRFAYAFPFGSVEYDFYYHTGNTQGMALFIANSDLNHYFPEFFKLIKRPRVPSSGQNGQWAATSVNQSPVSRASVAKGGRSAKEGAFTGSFSGTSSSSTGSSSASPSSRSIGN